MPAFAPPPTRLQPLEETRFGRAVSDPYRWLEDEGSAEVQAWMAAQDRAAREVLRALPARPALLRRFQELYRVEATGTPVVRGGRLFYGRTHPQLEKGVVHWRAGPDAPEQVLLDPNAWSEDGTVSLGVWVPSRDGRKVVFAERPNAADEATLYVLDVDSGRRSAVDVIAGAKYASPSWMPDSSGFVYAWLPVDPAIPVAERPGTCELRLHQLGQAPAQDERLYGPTGDPGTFLSGGVSFDGHTLLVSVARGWSENDVYVRRLGEADGWRQLVAGHAATYEVEALGDTLYVLTDEGAPRRRVFAVEAAHLERERWRELIPEHPSATREHLALVGGHLALASLDHAASVLELYALDGRRVREVPLPGPGTAGALSGTPDRAEAYFSFSSFVDPPVVFRLAVPDGEPRPWATVDLPLHPERYQVRQVWYPSKDGTPISMFIVAARNVRLDGDNPTLLTGYGGFAIAMRSAFSSFIYPWLEAGGVFAVPHLRGGGEYGKRWHDEGKGALKQHVFDDFHAAAEHLIAQGWTRPGRLAIRGGSNGGLLVGVAMTQRPELFKAVVCAVPLLDMLRYHRFGSGRTWVPEYGDPEDPRDFAVLADYSPYHHLTRGAPLPALLVMSSDHDDRVDPLHARKFVARVQALAGAPVALLRIEAHAGHGGADLVSEAVEASADQLAFLMATLGMDANSK
jgi:prolyl oligopeptidase